MLSITNQNWSTDFVNGGVSTINQTTGRTIKLSVAKPHKQLGLYPPLSARVTQHTRLIIINWNMWKKATEIKLCFVPPASTLQKGHCASSAEFVWHHFTSSCNSKPFSFCSNDHDHMNYSLKNSFTVSTAIVVAWLILEWMSASQSLGITYHVLLWN